MGQKVHPIGLRVGIIRDWESKWYAEKDYADLLHEDIKVRKYIETSLKDASVSKVEIERAANRVNITIHTAKPGILIGRKGEGVKKIRHALETLVGKKVDLDIKEISSPDTDAMLVARNVADQLERRIAYRRAMKRAIQQAMRQGAQGIKIMVAGRLGGAEMSRVVALRDGRVPLQTLRANLDFAKAEAGTTYGQLGVKVWIYKGDAIPETEEKVEATEGVYVSE